MNTLFALISNKYFGSFGISRFREFPYIDIFIYCLRLKTFIYILIPLEALRQLYKLGKLLYIKLSLVHSQEQ